jgi:Tol biopolymer transport system component
MGAACNGGGEALRTATPAPSPSATPHATATATAAAPPGTIVASFHDFNSEIYTVGSDGSRLTRITETSGHGEGTPEWAPDGRLAFVRGPLFGGKAELIVTKADGSDPASVVAGLDIMYPAWSPDGDRIAFLVDAGSVAYQGPLRCPQSRIPRLFLADVARATSGPLTELAAPDGCPIASTPRWSPDGTKIALVSRGVYVVDVASGRLTELVPPTDAVAAAWSPDGQRLAVAASLGSGGPSARIFIVGADGQGLTEIAQQLDWVHSLAWSPQGDLISVVTGNAYGGQGSLFVINSDGSGLRSLAQGVQGDVAWSPDGHRLAAALADPSSSQGGASNIYTVDVNDGSITRLTDVASSEYAPAWSPDGSAIAFVSRRDAQSGIFAIHADGALTPLLPGAGSQTFLDPDGHLVVLPDVSAEPSGWRDAFPLTEGTASPDGRRLADVVRGQGGFSDFRWWPSSWSPDGTRLVFAGCQGDPCQWGLFVVNADGGDLPKLVSPLVPYEAPTWSPDGSQLALVTNPDPCGPGEGVPPGYLEVVNVEEGTSQRLIERCVVRQILGWVP